jgi:hypothetical protein
VPGDLPARGRDRVPLEGCRDRDRAHTRSLALARGFVQLGLGVAIGNARARALYERLDYALLDAPPYVDRADHRDAAERLTVEEWCVFMVKNVRPAV